MQKRGFTFGNYVTAAHGWTLTGWTLSAAEPKTNYVEKPGGDGSWDFSTALTDGVMKYRDRELTATFECSEGNRAEREEKIRNMINTLDGMREVITPPDEDFYHIRGRLHVVRNYNDPAHASVTVTAVCDPWKYANAETIVALTASAAKKTAQLVNNGRRVLVPTLKVTSENADLLLEYGTSSMALTPGEYKWPDLVLTPGSHELTYSGIGSIVIAYREAVLE